jgi:hypothetical protein
MPRFLFGLLFICVVKAGAQEVKDSVFVLDYDYTQLYNSHSASLYKNYAAAGFTHSLGKGTMEYRGSVAGYKIAYGDADTELNTDNIENIISAKLQISYSRPVKGNLSALITFMPQLTSNFKEGIEIQDVIPNFFVGVKQKFGSKNPATLTIGGGYTAMFGKPIFLPIVNYSTVINQKTTLVLGLPYTAVGYTFSEKHSLRAIASADSFYAHIRGENYYTDAAGTQQQINTYRMLTFDAGIEYNYFSNNSWTSTVKAGHSFANSLALYGNGDNHINVDFNNNFYITMGFKYNLNF